MAASPEHFPDDGTNSVAQIFLARNEKLIPGIASCGGTTVYDILAGMRKLLSACAALTALSLPAAITLDATGHVYTDKETPSARGGTPGAAWTLTDWRGRPVGEPGTWRADGTAALPKLPTGYYHLKSGGEDATLMTPSIGFDPLLMTAPMLFSSMVESPPAKLPGLTEYCRTDLQ